MKVAILLIGNIRTWDQLKDNFAEAFRHLDPDVFVSTYDIRYGYHPAVQQHIQDTEDTFLTEEQIVDMFKTVNAVVVNVEKIDRARELFETEIAKMHPDFVSHPHSYLQYRKIRLATTLMEEYEKTNHIKYDYVIKARCDINHSKVELDIKSKQILLSSGNLYPNDVFFATNRDDFVTMSKFFMSEFYKPIYPDSHERPPHNLLLNAIKYCELDPIVRPIMQHVVRKNQIQYY